MNRRTRLEIDTGGRDRPLFMISVVSKMLHMHPQTLRQYERLGLIGPQRSHGRTRLYSYRDVDRLRLIQELTQKRRINLAGVKLVLELRSRVDEVQEEMRKTLETFMERFENTGKKAGKSGPARKQGKVHIRIEHG
jgi:MerR family transcriptional regulator, heat shock protein HspR